MEIIYRSKKMKNSRLNRPKRKGSGVLFKNPALEYMTKTHILIPLVLFSVISVCLIYYGLFEKGFAVTQMSLLFLLGCLVFTLFEYLIHRFVYHIGLKDYDKNHYSYKFHGVHYDYPKDKKRLAMPPVLALILATLFFILYRSLMGDFVFGFLAGFLMGYTLYLTIHYCIHIFKVPKNSLKILWHHHAIHHYSQPNKAFGVSSPLWDYIFGTMPERMNKVTSEGNFIDSSKQNI